MLHQPRCTSCRERGAHGTRASCRGESGVGGEPANAQLARRSVRGRLVNKHARRENKARSRRAHWRGGWSGLGLAMWGGCEGNLHEELLVMGGAGGLLTGLKEGGGQLATCARLLPLLPGGRRRRVDRMWLAVSRSRRSLKQADMTSLGHPPTATDPTCHASYFSCKRCASYFTGDLLTFSLTSTALWLA